MKVGSKKTIQISRGTSGFQMTSVSISNNVYQYRNSINE